MAYTASSGAVIRIGVDGAEESRRQIDSVATSMNRVSDTVSAAFKTLASTIGLGSGIAGIIQMSDEYTKYTSQLRLATQTNTEYASSLEVVRRIAHDAQQALAGTGTLYARITNGTRELGVSQQRVADITEVVSLGLKVSGATAAESASAQLQLSQAFASGTLRGEEFNAVNEAAPRLMLALADGIGVPVGALKNMASNGLITSQVMADVLPKALAQLREESKQVQSIGGAFTVLKNNVLEFTAVQAQSNGTVAILTKGIGLLADNLGFLMNVIATVSAAKLASTISGWIAKTYEKIVVDRLATTQTIALTQATVAETAAVLAAATARERELRAAVLAAEGHSILALTQNALIPAQARAAAAAQAHTAALAAQTAATGAAAVGGGILRGALGLLGGPVGAVVTVLGLAATAWSLFGSSSATASKTASENVRQSTAEIVEGLDKQIEKLRERNALSKAGISTTKSESAASVRLGEVVAELPKVAKGEGEYANLDLVARQAILQTLGREYGVLTAKIEAFNAETSLAANGTRADQLAKWFGENGTNAQKLAAELERLKKQFGEIPPEMEKLVRAQYADKGAAAAINKETTAYEMLIASIRTKTEENRLELAIGTDATESQKTSIKITQELASGKLKLSASHQEVVRAALAEQSASEQLIKAQSAEKDVLAWIIQSTQARLASNDALAIEYQLFGKSAEAREIAMVSIKAEAELLKEIAEIEKKNGKLSEESIAQMRREMGARVEVTRAALAQSKALGYAGQLKTDNERFAAESILDEKDRAAALLAIDAKLWQERIALAGEGTEAQRLLQEQYVTWYANQTNKPMIDRWRESVKKYDDIFRQGFADMLNSGKSGWASFTKSLATTFKTSVADQIYKMFAQPFVMKLVASLLGVTSSGVASAAGSAAGAAGIGAGVAGTIGAIGAGALQTSGALLAGEIGFSSTLSAGFSAIASGTASGLTAGFASVVGVLGPIALGIGAAVAIWKSMDNSGTYHTGGASSASAAGVNTIRAESLHFEATQVSAETEKLTAALASGIVGILDTTAQAFGKTAGYTAATAFADDTSGDGAWGGLVIEKLGAKILDWQDTKTGAWAPKVFADGAAGQAEYLAALSSSVRTVLDDIGLPSWATSMLDGLGAAPTIETLTSTVAKIVATQQALANLGNRLVGFSNLSDAAAAALMAAAGGIDALNTNASSYYNNFYSESEKTAAVTRQVSDAFASVGLTMPTTMEAFRAQVETQIALGESGAKATAVLLGVNDAFTSLFSKSSGATTVGNLASVNAGYQQQIDELLKSTMTVAQLRAAETVGMDASTVALYDRLAALKSSIAADEAAATALESARSAAATVLDSARTAVTTAYNAESSALKSVIEKSQALAVSMRSLGKSLLLSESSTLTPEQKYAEAQRQFDAATPENMESAAKALLDASKSYNGGNEQYARDFAKVQAAIAIAASRADAAATVAQSQLAVLNLQVAGIVQINESVLSVRDALASYQVAQVNAAAVNSGSSMGLNSAASVLGDTFSLDFYARVMAQQKLDGSHANGLDFVPFDGYRAELHRGERVQTAARVRNDAAAAEETNRLLREVITHLSASVAQGGAVGTQTLSKLQRVADGVAKTQRELARAS